MRRSWLRLILVVLAGGLLFGGVAMMALRWHNCLGSEYRSFTSPDGRFKLVVYAWRWDRWGYFPGQSGDRRGYVCLYEISSGRLLKTKPIAMVQMVDHVTWSPTNVEIRLFADWRLPP